MMEEAPSEGNSIPVSEAAIRQRHKRVIVNNRQEMDKLLQAQAGVNSCRYVKHWPEN